VSQQQIATYGSWPYNQWAVQGNTVQVDGQQVQQVQQVQVAQPQVASTYTVQQQVAPVATTYSVQAPTSVVAAGTPASTYKTLAGVSPLGLNYAYGYGLGQQWGVNTLGQQWGVNTLGLNTVVV